MAFNNVQFARSIISWWESESLKNELVEQEQFIAAFIPDLEDYIHVRYALLYSDFLLIADSQDL